MKLRIVLILILGLGVGFFLHASFVAAQSSFLSSPAFHISELLPQPLISRDWGFWGNKDAPGLDIVGDIQWRFIPASNDTYEGPAAILTGLRADGSGLQYTMDPPPDCSAPADRNADR